MLINKLELTNFRRFRDHVLQLSPKFNLIVGENASGKTAILEALAMLAGVVTVDSNHKIAKVRKITREQVRQKAFRQGQTLSLEPQYPSIVNVCGEYGGQSFNWGYSRSEESGKSDEDTKDIALAVSSLHREVRSGKKVDLPIVSFYGTQRLWSESPSPSGKAGIGLTSRLFGYKHCLDPSLSQEWLREWFRDSELLALQKKESNPTLEACRSALKQCIQDCEEVYYEGTLKNLVVRIGEQILPITYLSDGYRSMLSIVADIAIRCATLNPHLGEHAAIKTTGIVLIDELDLHLHPRWQRRIITDLMSAFPSIQFIATTHSPFVIRSLPEGKSTHLLNLDEGKESTIGDKSVEDIAEWIQGVDLPQRSGRYVEMMNKAQRYFQMLESDSAVTNEERLTARKELQRLTLPFGDSPAFHALVRMRELAAESSGKREDDELQDRAKRYIDLDGSRDNDTDHQAGMIGGEM